MPCFDGGPSIEQQREERMIPAVLCGILSVLEDMNVLLNVLDRVNWKEVGVERRELHDWWTKHKRADAARREMEARTQERMRLIRQGLDKLTPEERAAIVGAAPDTRSRSVASEG